MAIICKQNIQSMSTDATDEIGIDDNINDSDDDENICHRRNHTKRYNLFDDDDDNDALEAQNTPDKGPGDEEIAGIDRHDTAATDKEKTDYVPAKAIESEAANNIDVNNPEQQKEAQQETGGDVIIRIDINKTTATGNDIESDAAGNEKRSAKKELGGKRRKRVKKYQEQLMSRLNIGQLVEKRENNTDNN